MHSLVPQATSPETHSSRGQVRPPYMSSTTSPEPGVGRSWRGDLWILCFHQYCIRRPAPPSPQPTPRPPTEPSLHVRQVAWGGPTPPTALGAH